jgi:hypothetical protein
VSAALLQDSDSIGLGGSSDILEEFSSGASVENQWIKPPWHYLLYPKVQRVKC